MMFAKLDPDEAQMLLDSIKPRLAEKLPEPELGALHTGHAKLLSAVQSDPAAWYRHLVAQGKHPNEARAHVRHRFGAVE